MSEIEEGEGIVLHKSGPLLDSEFHIEKKKMELLDDNYAYGIGVEHLPFAVEYPCEVIDSPLSIFPSQNSFALPKNSKLKGLFNHYIKILDESGQLDRLFQRHMVPQFKRDKSYDCSQGELSKGLGLPETLFCFVVVLVGITLAIAFFAAEKFSQFLS